MKENIVSSWEANAEVWINVIEQNEIASRKFTNRAIIEKIMGNEGQKVVDIGCGEGWLTREITAMGKQGIGLDAVEKLLQRARKKGKESFYQMTYEDIATGKSIPEGPHDIAVFNFCLYQKEGLFELLSNTLSALSPYGCIFIQTLHPSFLTQQYLPYKSQWIEDSWKGLSRKFGKPHKWYARTFEGWSRELNKLSDSVVEMSEVINDNEHPISLILKIQKTG